MEVSNINVSSTSLVQQVQQQSQTQEQQSSNELSSSTTIPTRRSEVSQRQLLSNNILVRKQQNSRSSPNSKILATNTIDSNNYSVSSSFVINPKIRVRPYNSISPLHSQKETSLNSMVEAQKLNNLLTKNAKLISNGNQSQNKSPSFYQKKANQNFVQIYNYSYNPLTGEVVKTKEQNKEISLPNKKLTSKYMTENLTDNKENQQLASIFTLDLDRHIQKPSEEDKSPSGVHSNLYDIKQASSSQTLSTLHHNNSTLNSSQTLMRNYKIHKNIKVNRNNPYSTKELLIPIHKLDNYSETSSHLLTDQMRNEASEIQENSTVPPQLPISQVIKINFDQEQKENQIKVSQTNTIPIPTGQSEDKNRRIPILNSKQSLINKIKQHQVINGDSKNILEQILKGERNKKNHLQMIEQKPRQIFERQRSLTTQHQLNYQSLNNIDRQESLPKIQQYHSNNLSQINGNFNVNKQIQPNPKESNRRISIQKRLQDLMSYNVEEEFKKRFQGIFKEKYAEKPLKILKRNDAKKKVHFVFDEAIIQ